MANTKISQLTATTTPTGSEELVYALNNANGKMTLNTMKWYVENNLSWYATTADLASKQDTLVSATNIKTINNSSILWSWNLDISWWVAYTAWPWIDITWWVISATWWGWSSVDLIAWYNASAWDAVSVNSSWKFRKVLWTRWVSVQDKWDDTCDSNSLLKSTNVWWNKMLYVCSVWWYLKLYICDNQFSEWTVTTTYRWYYFDVFSPTEWYAIVTYRDRDNSNKAYCFAVDCTWSTPTYWTSTAVSSWQTKWNDNQSSVRVQDADSTDFCVLYVLNTDSKCYYNLCSFDTSTLNITVWTETEFNGNINTLNNSPFAYLWNGMIWYVYAYVDLLDSNITNYVFWVRSYNNWSMSAGWWSFSLWQNLWATWADSQIVPNWTWWIISISEYVWVYSFQDYFLWNHSSDYNNYVITTMIQDWYNSTRKSYKSVDWWKHVLWVYITPTSIIYNKYVVSRAWMNKVWWKELSVSWYTTPTNHVSIQEINLDNSSITNTADWDYRVIFLNSSRQPVVTESASNWWKFIWVVSANTASWVMWTVLIWWTVPWTFTSAWNRVYVWNWTLTENVTDYPVWFSISTTEAVLINWLN